MTQGIFVNGNRPKSKKQIKEVFADGGVVSLEATSVFRNEHSGNIKNLPVGQYFFVGPNPYNNRKFYGQIIVKEDGAIQIK